MLRPEYLAQRLTPYPLPTCSAPLVMLTSTSWRCRRSADYVFTGNTPVGCSCNKPVRQRSPGRFILRCLWTANLTLVHSSTCAGLSARDMPLHRSRAGAGGTCAGLHKVLCPLTQDCRCLTAVDMRAQCPCLPRG